MSTISVSNASKTWLVKVQELKLKYVYELSIWRLVDEVSMYNLGMRRNVELWHVLEFTKVQSLACMILEIYYNFYYFLLICSMVCDPFDAKCSVIYSLPFSCNMELLVESELFSLISNNSILRFSLFLECYILWFVTLSNKVCSLICGTLFLLSGKNGAAYRASS